ncbi:MAG: hypothetical protein BWY26_00678 [Elusimicrobia bacterium ADurb.Bin231]|nr:MAG: hypothetical protein BWY26_00678 [Elusimicrobia bacterium ADurb.Bin231]
MDNNFVIEIDTKKNVEFIDITERIQEIVFLKKQTTGQCFITVPHTTAGITINENADPDVVSDIIAYLDRSVPSNDTRYKHSEGNSAAHIKSSLMGTSLSVIIENGNLKLGTWQGIYFCEFDGPRKRKIWIKIT